MPELIDIDWVRNLSLELAAFEDDRIGPYTFEHVNRELYNDSDEIIASLPALYRVRMGDETLFESEAREAAYKYYTMVIMK